MKNGQTSDNKGAGGRLCCGHRKLSGRRGQRCPVSFLAWQSWCSEAVQAIRAGFRPAAAKIDRTIEREREIIAELQGCAPRELREKAKHYDLEAKLLVRRTGLVTVIAAMGVVALNLQSTGERAKFWGNPESTSILVMQTLSQKEGRAQAGPS